MFTSVSDVRMGTTVKGSDGKKVGRVNEIVNVPDAPANASGEHDHLFMEVAEGDILEFWKGTLYIPFAAIASTSAGQEIELDCTSAEAMERYTEKPSALR